MFRKLLIRALGAVRGMPSNAASHLEAIGRHADAILGPSRFDLHERYSPDIHVDLLHYAPTGDRGFQYLVTLGMSDREMTDAGEEIAEPLVELVVALPSHWDVSPNGFQNPAVFEPVKLTKGLARYPHSNGTYFAEGHTIPIGKESSVEPMTAALLMQPVLVPEFREPLMIERGRYIRFLAWTLLHQDELDFKLRNGANALFDRLTRGGVTEMYDLARPSVCEDAR
jgi:hypothetical protein